MFPPAYNFPDQLSTNPVRSQMQDDPYGQQTSWHALVQQQVGDLTIPQRTNSPQVSSPQSSTSSKAEGSSHLNHFSSQLSAAAQAMGWSIPADLVTRLQDQYPQHANWSSSYHADNFSLQSEQLNHIVQPQLPGTVKTEDNRTSQLSSLPNDANQHLLEPSLYSIDDNAQTNGGGCERTKPKNRQGVAKRPGACARCRRLKMKCTFASDSAEICSRCSVGGHECVFPGRKPRSPGMRMVLRQQIREKDAMIDTLLNQVNPGPVMATPLSLVPSRLPLTTEERSAYRDVLTYLERLTAQNSARFMGEGRAKFDISALEDVSEESGESDDEAPDGVTSPRRASSPRVGITHQVDTLLEASAPTGMLASASLQHSRATAKSTVESTSDGASSHNSSAEGGIASETYFLPGPSSNLELRRLIVERQAAPDILLSGLVTPDDVAKLFQIHYQWINPIIPILDENIHTPAAVLGRCPFLFTVICAVASRYYQEKPHIYGMAMHFAKAAAANAVIDGWKTIEMCQAFALWSVYNPPARRWEDDRAWCYTGIAFRLAAELNLSKIPDVTPTDERHEREILSRTRIWIMCYIMDRCLSIQSGKAWMVPEDQTVRNATVWCQSSKYQGPCDNYLASHASLLCIMSRFVGTVNPASETNSGQPNKDLDFVEIQKIYDEELLAWKSRTDVRHKDDKSSGDPARVMQITLIYCVFNYCRLVIFSYGLQQMTKRNKLKEDTIYFTGCIQAASSLVKLMVEDFMPTGFVKYFPELVYVHAAFGAVVLLKCLRPEFRQMMDEQQEERIVDIIKGLFDAWTSDDFSKDERHNTQIYARFLKQLLDPHIARIEKRRMGASAVDASLNSSSTSEFTPSPISDDTPSFQFPDAAPFDVDMKALPQSMEGMVSDAGGSWEELYSQALNSGYLGGAAGGEELLGMGNDYMAAMMSMGNETWFF